MTIGLRLLKLNNEEMTIREIYPELDTIRVDLDVMGMFGNVELATIVGFVETIFLHLKDKSEYVNILPETFRNMGFSLQKFYRCINEYINAFPEEVCQFKKIRIDNKIYFRLNLKEAVNDKER
jgi:hypothetical protein